MVVRGKDKLGKVFHRDIPAIQRKRAFRTDLRRRKKLKVENHFDDGQTALEFQQQQNGLVQNRIGFTLILQLHE